MDRFVTIPPQEVVLNERRLDAPHALDNRLPRRLAQVSADDRER
jgi:hypothetical protein